MSEIKTKSIKYNYMMNVIFTVSSILFPIISFPYVTRVIGPEGTGKVSFATSLIVYFNMFAQLGIPTYGIRACAKVRDDRNELTKTVQELLIINLITSLISYVIFAIIIIFVPRLQEERLLYIIVSSSILLSALGIEWLYKGLERYTYITTRSVFFKFVALVLMFVLIHKSEDYIIYGCLSIFAAAACNILNLINAHKYVSFKPVGNYNFKRHLKPVLIFFAMSCATTVYTHLDTLMLGFIRDDTEVGYYDVAIRFKTILLSFVTSLAAVILPRASYYVEKQMMDDFNRICKKTINFILLISIPMCVYFMLVGRESILLLAGNKYEASIIPMIVLMPTLLFIGISYTTGIQMLVPLGKEKYVFYSEIGGMITDFVLNIILIPKLGATGAAIGTLIAEIVVLSFQLIVLRSWIAKNVLDFNYLRILSALFIAGFGCGGGLLFLRQYQIDSIIIMVITAIIFFGLYGGYMLILREPIVIEMFETIKRLLGKNNGKI